MPRLCPWLPSLRGINISDGKPRPIAVSYLGTSCRIVVHSRPSGTARISSSSNPYRRFGLSYADGFVTCRVAVLFSLQSWLGESEETRKGNGTPGYFNVGMAGTQFLCPKKISLLTSDMLFSDIPVRYVPSPLSPTTRRESSEPNRRRRPDPWGGIVDNDETT